MMSGQVSEKDETRGWDDNARNKQFTLETSTSKGGRRDLT
ncbi:hypothetical protein V6Z12_A12G077300 [Gossypium hirsutum]